MQEKAKEIGVSVTPKTNGVPSFAAKKNDSGGVRAETISRFIKGGASGLISALLLQPL